jgi:hypothetical protein
MQPAKAAPKAKKLYRKVKKAFVFSLYLFPKSFLTMNPMTAKKMRMQNGRK